MNIKNHIWVKILLLLILLVLFLSSIVNFVVDPYGIYKTSFFPNKPREATQARLMKSFELENIKPSSIVIGTSRADLGIDPEHMYFEKPSYNSSIPGASIYEIKFYVEKAIKLGNLKQILFVADWRMFNDMLKKVDDFESYFNNFNKLKFLLNIQSLEDSYFTIKNQASKSMYLNNGLLEDKHMSTHVKNSGGHLALMNKDDSFYYSIFPKSNNFYQGTIRSSFDDFKDILEMCYKNNIKLEIIFGPSHIRQWEAFNYYHNIDIFYKWKKDVVLAVNHVAKEKNKNPFKVYDFSVYHDFTAEKVPTDPNVTMKYHWESSHYKKELGNIVLDRLLGISPYKDFGVELNTNNIDDHINKLKNDRNKFMDVYQYRKEVFGEN